jgi:hypothetical protein
MSKAVVRTLLRAGAGVVAALCCLAPGQVAAADLPEPVPVPPLPAIDPSGVGAGSAPLVPVPPGCAAPGREQAVFVGTLEARDATTARFAIERVRSGSVDGFALDGRIDVYFGDEVRFLGEGTSYIVGAGIDVERRALVSTVREPAPLFGGSEVAGITTGASECPTIDDPMRTLHVDGSDVESGVLAPLRGNGGMVLRAILQPLGAALLVLLGLVAVKHLLFALGRSLRDLR